MGLQDKISGRVKQAAGDLLGDEDVRRQGIDDERKGEEKEALARQREKVQGELDALDERQRRVDEMEGKTDRDGIARDQERARLEDDARERGVDRP